MRKKFLRRILVPIDGSKSSLRGLQFGINLAKQNKSQITLIQIIPKAFAYGLTDSNKIQKKIRNKAESNLKLTLGLCTKNNVMATKKLIIDQNIGQSILNHAERNDFDLIIIGSRGPDPSFGIFLGSVANFVVHKSKLPVLLIK